MRKLVVLSLSAAALACGGSGSNGGAGVPTGTVAGRAFAVVEARAVAAATAAAPCSVPNPGGAGTIDIGIRALKIDLASYADVCGDYASAQCSLHAGSQTVTILLAKLNPLPPYGPPALAAGTYVVQPSPTVVIPDGTGLLTVAYAQALGTGAAPTCAGAPSPAVQGGTLRVDEASGTRVAGAVSLAFADGSAVQGDFSAPICPGVAPDVCQLAAAQALCGLPPVCR